MTRKPEPKVIGLLGGMSWPSTITYYRMINSIVQTQLGGSHSARLVLWSDDYYKVEQMQLNGQWREAGDWLVQSARRLEAAGADLLGIACNTMHIVADAVRNRTGLPLVDMVETAAAACAKRALPAAVLGTRFTLQMGRYSDALSRRGVTPILPSLTHITNLDRVIYDELCLGRTSQAARRVVLDIIADLVGRGAGQILLACTELNLIIKEDISVGAYVVDATQAHIEALVAASLGIQGANG